MEPLTLADPKELGGIALSGRLGQGGMGVVYFGANVQGLTLGEYTERQGALPAELGAALGVLLAEALTEIHKAGLLHRDFKPGNIILDCACQSTLVHLQRRPPEFEVCLPGWSRPTRRRPACARCRQRCGGIVHPLPAMGACEACDAGSGCHLPAQRYRLRGVPCARPGGFECQQCGLPSGYGDHQDLA